MNESQIKKNERENDYLHATFKIGLSELVVVLPLVFYVVLCRLAYCYDAAKSHVRIYHLAQCRHRQAFVD